MWHFEKKIVTFRTNTKLWDFEWNCETLNESVTLSSKMWHFDYFCDMIICVMQNFIFLPPFYRYIFYKGRVSKFYFLYYR